jgi:hypothetical protein
MNNLINVYHLRDAYDHSLGYGINNNYTNLPEDSIKEVISKQERYIKSGDLGGYWVQVVNYEVGGEYTIVDHIKTLPQKTRIELNVKAKRTGSTKRASIELALHEMQLPVAPAVVNNVWNHVVAGPEFAQVEQEDLI